MITIAIVGRPNVGKSTLFNVLASKRISITHKEVGVTRDTVGFTCKRKNKQLHIQDLAGFLGEGPYAQQLTQRGLDTIQHVDIILFVVSVEALSTEDYELMSLLRPMMSKVLLVVNKVDNEERQWAAQEYYALGYDPLICISAVHRRNIDVLWETIDAKIERIPVPSDFDSHNGHEDTKFQNDVVSSRGTTDSDKEAHGDEESSDSNTNVLSQSFSNPCHLLILGKPNSGKSSFFNYLLSRPQNLVSSIPCTTRDSILEYITWKDKRYAIVDTAGLRRKANVSGDVEYYANQHAITHINSSDIVLLFVDVLEGSLSEQDKKITSLALSRRKSIILCLNKWDLIEHKEKTLQVLKERISYAAPQMHFVPICKMSAKTGEGVEQLFKHIYSIQKQLSNKIATSHINYILQKAMKEHPPSMIKNRRAKLYFAVQSSTHPMSFELHVNARFLFSESYCTYLIRIIRKQYALSAIPIFLTLTEKEKNKAG